MALQILKHGQPPKNSRKSQVPDRVTALFLAVARNKPDYNKIPKRQGMEENRSWGYKSHVAAVESP